MIIDKNSKNRKYISFLFLTIGALILYFSNGRYFFAPAAWLSPIFILLFTRRNNPILGYFINSFVMGTCTLISFLKFSSSNPANPLYYLPFALGFLISIPYLIDRIVHLKSNNLLKSLIFPLSYVLIEFVYVTLSPLGSTGSIAYTQMEFLPIIQIVSITGIYGVTFLVTWSSSIIASVIDETDISSVKKLLMVYGMVFAIVMAYAGIRLLPEDTSKTVQVSGINAYDLRSKEVKEKWANIETDTKGFQTLCDDIFNKLIEITKKEAQAGSKAIIWAEISPIELYKDQNKYTKIISNLAKEYGVYIITSPDVLAENLIGDSVNKLEIFDPKGQIVLKHLKYGGAMFDDIIEGKKEITTVKTPYGNWGGAICWDADFPDVLRQAGKQKVDILFSPAADWKEVTPIHSANAYFRGIENGMSVIRQTADGLSFASDNKGRFLSKMNHFTSDEWVMRAQIPTEGCFTLYPYIADTFVIICFLGLLGLILKSYRLQKAININHKC